MKSFIKPLMVVVLAVLATAAFSQNSRVFQYERPVNYDGLNVFETPKTDTIGFDEMRFRVGGDFAIIFQGLSQSNDASAPEELAELSNNFALPTANLNLDVQIVDGVRMHLRTYLSSRHHPEAWVKGGYFQMDNLNFISDGFLSGLMEVATIRFGMDEINYGDTHFRRSDNARSLYNPFVGNFIMDAFTTEPFAEVTVQNNGLIGVLGVSNGRLNQSPTSGDNGRVWYAKLGYDKQINDDFRFRLTGSVYNSTSNSTRDYLYNGDRAGARYYSVLHGTEGGSDFLPRFNPNFGSHTAFQINPFLKYQGLEFFGVFEITNNSADAGGDFTQTGAELIYRFGGWDQLYIAGRYNKVSGNSADGAADREINRTNIGGGWFLTKNVLAKLEYVKQSYDGAAWDTTLFQGAEFDGIVIEAVISF